MSLLRFRAPGASLDAQGLMALVLPGQEAEPVLRAGSLRRARVTPSGWVAGAPLRRPRARVTPGGAYCLETEGLGAAEPGPRLGTRAVALLPDWPWWRGAVSRAGFRWEAVAATQGATRVAFESLDDEPLDPLAIRRWAEAAGAPVLGDLEHGGHACGGEMRLADGAADLAWPDTPLTAPAFPAPDAELRVSQETVHALRRGHPWVLPDSETGDGSRFARGALVRLRAGDDLPQALARIEAEPRLMARVWAQGAEGEADPRSVEARVVEAAARRAPLRDGAATEAGTDVFRLVHGEADDLPGLEIDRVGGALRVLVSGPAALPIRERAWRTALGLSGLDPDAPVVEALHFRQLPPGRTEAVRLVHGVWPDSWSTGPVAREGELRFRMDLGLGEPDRPHPGVGLFSDQRENRERVAARVVPGGRYANLFAHTGAFSAAMLAAGAGDVVSVDLSARYLEWLEENLERSGLSGLAHVSVQRDVRQWLEGQAGAQPFDGIVIDPPTAAAAGRRFWSAQKEMRSLLAGLVERLAPGGFLLVTRNERRGRKPLSGALERAARDAGRQLAGRAPAPPSFDYPERAGFPEGSAFEGILATFH